MPKKKNGSALDHLDAARQHLGGNGDGNDTLSRVGAAMADAAKGAPPPAADAEDEEEHELQPDHQAAARVAAETLTGDIRDFILDRLRFEQDKRPWHDRSEAEQKETIARVESATRDLVTRAVQVIAAGGLQTIKATLDSITVKDGMKAVFTMPKHDPLRHRLIDAQGSTVMIVVADAEAFTGERAPAEATPDQREIPLAEHSQADDNNRPLFN